MSRRDKAGCEHCRSHIEFTEKVFAEDTAKKVEIDGMGILEVKHEYLLIGNGMGADFEQVELRDWSGCKKSDSRYPRPSPEYSDGAQQPRRDRPSSSGRRCPTESCRGRKWFTDTATIIW